MRGFRGGDVARDELGVRIGGFDLVDAVQDVLGVAVRRVENERVRTRREKRASAFHDVLRHADGGGAEKTALGILRGVRILIGLFDVLDRDEAAEFEIAVDDRELLDLVAAEDVAGFHERGADGDRDEVFLRHDVVDLHVEVGHEAQVAVGDDADEVAFVVADRYAGDLVLAHEFIRFVDIVLRMEEERIRDDAVLASLHALHLIALRFDGHVLVNDADAALACHGDRHFGFGDGIHRRAHERDVERDLVRQAGLEGNGAREHLALLGNEKDVVKCQAFISDFVCNHVVRHLGYHAFLQNFRSKQRKRCAIARPMDIFVIILDMPRKVNRERAQSLWAAIGGFCMRRHTAGKGALLRVLSVCTAPFNSRLKTKQQIDH